MTSGFTSLPWRERVALYATVESALVFAWVTLAKRERRRARQGRKFPLDFARRGN